MTGPKGETSLEIGGFTGFCELPIHTISWTIPNATSSVIIFHGYGDHSARYDKLARSLNSDGVDVFSYDYQGHGRSGGRWGYIQDFNDLVYDAKSVVTDVSTRRQDKPLFLLGHSVGSLLIANLLVNRKIAGRVAGAVMMSPTIETPGAPPDLAVSAMSAASSFIGQVPLSSIDPDKVSLDPNAVAALKADPFALHRPIGLRTSVQLIRGGRMTLKLASDITAPSMVLYGALDGLSLPAGSEAFYEAISSEDKVLVKYPESGHELFNDPATPEVVAGITEWLHERTPDA